MRRILPLLAVGLALGAQAPKARSWTGYRPAAWERKGTDAPPAERERFRFAPPRKDAPGAIPGAVVEVWGDASWARQDEFKAFVRANLSGFRTAFDAGLGASIGGDHLANLMAGDPSSRPPLIWSQVWFNSQNPWARDRRYYR